MKLRVISDTEACYVGSIDAAIGMIVKGGQTIKKVNEKSVLVKGLDSDDKLTDASILYSEAVKHGFKVIESHELELEAAKRRKFKEGEWWYEHCGEITDLKILEDATVKAGYEFAKATAILRELALKGL